MEKLSIDSDSYSWYNTFFSQACLLVWSQDQVHKDSFLLYEGTTSKVSSYSFRVLFETSLNNMFLERQIFKMSKTSGSAHGNGDG